MKALSLVLVEMSPEARALAVAAARLAFPTATLTDVHSVDEALKNESAAGPELLLLCEPDRTSLAQATAPTNTLGLRRWKVIVFGTSPAHGAGVAAVLAPEDWRAPLVAQVFQTTARLQALECENARLRGDLATIGRRISHDLRTPLTAIHTACEAINEIMAEHTLDHTPFTQAITGSTNELVQLIERVNLLLRASTDPGPNEPVAMEEIVFGTLQRLEGRIQRNGAAVIQPTTWPVVNGVAAWLEIIWFNLMVNALQHSPAAPRIELGWSEAHGQFRFWVDDRGPGVDQEKVGRLFQPFHLLHRLNAPRGLGLSLVQRFVELQGGTCGYESLAHGGARFFFTLPAPPGS